MTSIKSLRFCRLPVLSVTSAYTNGGPPDGAAIADVRTIWVYATGVAIETATMCYPVAGNTGRHARMCSAVVARAQHR